MRLLIPDTWHFHRRNFLPLFRCLARDGVESYVDRSRRRWWKRHGHYRDIQRLASHRRRLEVLSPADLFAYRHRDIPVFACVRAELLCLLLPRPRWCDGTGPNDAAAVFRRAIEDAEDRCDLLCCMAAACDWIEHWTALLEQRGPFTHVLIFSGSYIYTRTLQEIGRRVGLRLFCLETFFTGNEFYFEERSTPIANRSLLADPEWYARLKLPTTPSARERLRAEAHRRLATMRNKNVPVQEDSAPAPPFTERSGGTVLLIGQVLNDFSLIETPLREASPLPVYRRLIGGILERTPCNVVFKAHPWERRRPNLRRPFTREAIETWAAELPGHRRARLRVIEEQPLGTLFPHIDYAVSLCSQGLLEACQAGLKPAQIGAAFFGGRGFTHDYDEADAFLDDLAAGRVSTTLTLAEYRLFEDFLARALIMHLVPNRPEGEATMTERLADPCHVPDWTTTLARLADHDPMRIPSLGILISEFLRRPLPWLQMLRQRRR